MKNFAAFILLIFIAGCSTTPYYELPYEFRNNNARTSFIQNHFTYFTGKTFFIDPGHGGSDRNNVGYKGEAVEADANLAVALALRNYLKEAGAKVILSRSKDTTVNLKDRSIIANKSGADFFISIHHNAPADANDIYTNYSHVYYHASEGDYTFEPCNHDLAKYIQRDLSYAMRNSGGPASFDGTSSDYTIYPKQGFSVLRLSNIPAVLVECGFTTSHFESQRITIPEFNKIESWGIFKGIARYLEEQRPTIIYDSLQYVTENDSLIVKINDPNGIDDNSLDLFIDSTGQIDRIADVSEENVHYSYTNGTSGSKSLGATIKIDLSGLTPGVHDLKIIAANNKGNFSLPFRKKFVISENKKK